MHMHAQADGRMQYFWQLWDMFNIRQHGLSGIYWPALVPMLNSTGYAQVQNVQIWPALFICCCPLDAKQHSIFEACVHTLLCIWVDGCVLPATWVNLGPADDVKQVLWC
eukprot:1158233-Pelagomonas_calceolata.AAC.9